MEQISLNLTVEEVNQILESLAQLPYIKVCQIINKIQVQAEAQLQAKEQHQQEEQNPISNS
ncbi:MAG: hypothetical protein QNJ64_13265 [Crocosphaera sp.]|nr:hypothetical protein [Crocosphaera sp.]